MIIEEMFQLVLNKIDANHKELKTEFKTEIARLEAKIDANHKELTDKILDLQIQINEAKIVTVGLKGDILDLRDDVKKLDSLAKSVKLLDRVTADIYGRIGRQKTR